MTTPLDPNLLNAQMSGQDLIRRKLEMDALRKRLVDPDAKDKKLREAVEGFEAIFIQKMWQQMRATVPKEGYLHGKDEEFWQGMFDQELSKKMASAGGIGLADMLVEQLQSSMGSASRTTAPSRVSTPVPVEPLRHADRPEDTPLRQDIPHDDSLYSPLNDAQDQMTDEQGIILPSPLPLIPPQGMPPATPATPAATQPGRAAPLRSAPLSSGLSPQSQGTQPHAQAHFTAQDSSVHTEVDRIARSILTGTPADEPSGVGGASPSMRRPPLQAPAQVNPGYGMPPRRDGATYDPEDLQHSAAVSRAGSAGFAERNEGTLAMGGPVSRNPEMGMLNWPLPGRITSGFGWRDDPFTGMREWHAGMDIAGNVGDPVAAAWDGKVVFAGEREGYGNLVVLEHEGGWHTYYGHNSKLTVAEGDYISSGRKIAEVGSTGRSTGPHLHFEIRQGELAWNPEQVRNRLLAGLSVGRRS
ncbi:peptidoglycan DD-metalloendopeptidase family protein [Desulfovibrio psychrotolerans]|uniref:Peptidase M24 n=1 Tax=Desulfovibrio psychrotolerans TaxID=415242 RepID=A0A7J0BVP4_9BACT|nr:peptidoglycan DD-metalloendopeptidase family protein [Desulfovibrio psychrotolerans]GFM37796.1 hypothetical protein DSM19430T_24800 [Desulfovibrio psychrotolerans]